MRFFSTREERLYIATIALSVVVFLTLACLMIVGILWHIDKRSISEQQVEIDQLKLSLQNYDLEISALQGLLNIKSDKEIEELTRED